MEHRIATRQEWLAARKALLEKEKQLTRLRDQINAERLALPWVKVEKEYVFDTVGGPKTLADLFEGRSQLLVQHFMFGPDWEAGCVGCSFGADHADAAYQHLKHHDVTYVAIARAPIEKLEAYRRRMGWRFSFASSYRNDFNYDFHVSFPKEALENGKVFYNFREIDGKDAYDELPGASAFYKDADGTVYHTYSQYARGGEEVLSAYMLLDMAPLGRNETAPALMMGWVKRHDEYPEEAGA
jgi:Uncharacterized protein conserved in bacteria